MVIMALYLTFYPKCILSTLYQFILNIFQSLINHLFYEIKICSRAIIWKIISRFFTSDTINWNDYRRSMSGYWYLKLRNEIYILIFINVFTLYFCFFLSNPYTSLIFYNHMYNHLYIELYIYLYGLLNIFPDVSQYASTRLGKMWRKFCLFPQKNLISTQNGIFFTKNC